MSSLSRHSLSTLARRLCNAVTPHVRSSGKLDADIRATLTNVLSDRSFHTTTGINPSQVQRTKLLETFKSNNFQQMIHIPKCSISSFQKPLSPSTQSILRKSSVFTTNMRPLSYGQPNPNQFFTQMFAGIAEAAWRTLPPHLRNAILWKGIVALLAFIILFFVVLFNFGLAVRIAFFALIYKIFRNNVIIPALLRMRQPRLALALETWGRSELSRNKAWYLLYCMNPFNWLSPIQMVMKPHQADITRRMEVFSDVAPNILKDRRFRERCAGCYLGPLEMDFEAMSGIDSDNTMFHGWVSAPVVSSQKVVKTPFSSGTSITVMYDSHGNARFKKVEPEESVHGYKVVGRVYIFFTKDAITRATSGQGNFNVDGNKLRWDPYVVFMKGANEPYSACKVMLSTKQGKEVLWSKDTVEWDLEDGEKAREEFARRRATAEMNKDREDDEPIVLDVNEEGGRVMEAQFEETPQEKDKKK